MKPYCMVISTPLSWHRGADLVLASGLISGPIFLASWVEQANHWVALIGGLMGLFIGSVRVYEIVRGYLRKTKDE